MPRGEIRSQGGKRKRGKVASDDGGNEPADVFVVNGLCSHEPLCSSVPSFYYNSSSRGHVTCITLRNFPDL